MSNNSPIGIFDSGVGGLTFARTIRKVLPKENIVYFGDLAHFPYGDKSREAIQLYAQKITKFLVSSFNCKLILIACNTASAYAFEAVKEYVKENIIIVNVIDPVTNLVAKSNYKRIGVIATKGTISSGIYKTKINHLNDKIKISSLATPLFAPMIEEGFINDKISNAIIEAYLSQKAIENIEALILGCTHYPIIKKQIATFYNNSITIIDANTITVQQIAKTLDKHSLLNTDKSPPKYKFYVSDYTHNFETISELFFQNARIQLQKIEL